MGGSLGGADTRGGGILIGKAEKIGTWSLKKAVALLYNY